MLATQTNVAPHAHSSGPYQIHLHLSDSAAGQCVVSPKARMDPPRPLEPRPTHNTTLPLHDGHRLERRPDIFGYNAQATAAPRAPLSSANPQSLPSVRDILSPRSGPPHYPSHDSWTSQGQTISHHHNHPQHPPEYQHALPSAHPHQAYPPPRPEHYGSPLSQHDRRHDIHPLEHHPVGYPPQATAGAPSHTSYRDSYREAVENGYSRQRQQSTSSYATGSISSPYTPTTHDEFASRGPNGVFDKVAPPPFPPHGIESTKRYLGTQEFPGEGTFHVYEGGHRLPTEVDGESVNPQWGLTKANKPRKRLAVACLDCREKKIKCEPGANSCLQCEKAKRPCRKGPSTQHHHEGSASNDWSSNAGSPPATTSSSNAETNSYSKKDLATKRRAADELPSTGEVQKRHKSTSPTEHSGVLLGATNGVSAHPQAHHVAFTEHDDPMSVDGDVTLQLIHTYLYAFNNGVYGIFPRQKLLRWATSDKQKSASDIMILHAIMATASIYHDSTLAAVGEHCAKLANSALSTKFGRFSLQVIHTRLLLALYSFAKDGQGPSWDYCGTAMRSISALHLNNEEGCLAQGESGVEDYDLSHNQIVECRRRTFWCAFMMDRLHSFGEGMLCTIDKADVYLRLPCADSTYEQGGSSESPFFDNGIIDTIKTDSTTTTETSIMAHMALVVAISADVIKFVNRGVHRSDQGRAAAYEQFYNESYERLCSWKSKLPAYLQYNSENLRRSVHDGFAGDFITMHILYHSTLVKLNRCMRWSLLLDKLARNICEAHLHAGKVLSAVDEYNTARTEVTTNHQHNFSTPFAGYAILSAIDVISAGGHDNLIGQTIASIQHAQTCLHALGAFWTSAAEQARHADTRFQQLRNIIVRPYKANSGCWLGREWGMEEPLEKELDLKDDCIYGVEHGIYFEALDRLRTRTHQQRG